MYELHITPKPEFVHDFVDICTRLKLKLITHFNYDKNIDYLYAETMLAEKCETLSELNYKIELMLRTAKQHNLLRIKVESKISDDFKYLVPYKICSQYFEAHIDIETKNINELKCICSYYKTYISKNPSKSNYMLTLRTNIIQEYKSELTSVLKYLKEHNISYSRILKEYCFLDDNIKVDDPWVNSYKTKIKE